MMEVKAEEEGEAEAEAEGSCAVNWLDWGALSSGCLHW